jgi:D-glycero-D-manno-heptose 1,7-bisphosphate phosphatase
MTPQAEAMHQVRLVILDRDGVINHDSDDFIRTPAEWIPIAGSLEGIALLTRAGFTVTVATNQSGIGRGLYDDAALDAIHQKMRRAVAEAGGAIDHIVYCPHAPDDGCDCRKPAAGLLRNLGRHYGVALAGVPAIGDTERDLAAARAVGARPILVLTGNGETTRRTLAERGEKVETWPNLLETARALAGEA